MRKFFIILAILIVIRIFATFAVNDEWGLLFLVGIPFGILSNLAIPVMFAVVPVKIVVDVIRRRDLPYARALVMTVVFLLATRVAKLPPISVDLSSNDVASQPSIPHGVTWYDWFFYEPDMLVEMVAAAIAVVVLLVAIVWKRAQAKATPSAGDMQ